MLKEIDLEYNGKLFDVKLEEGNEVLGDRK